MNVGKKSVYGKVLADVSDIGRSHSKNDTSHLFTTELRRTMYFIIIVEMYVDMPILTKTPLNSMMKYQLTRLAYHPSKCCQLVSKV